MPGPLDSCVNYIYEDGNIPASSGTPPKRVLIRDALEAAISEAAEAEEALDTFLGLFVVEAASAADVVTAGLVTDVAIAEPALALDNFDAIFAVGIFVDVAEAATATATQDGTVTGATARQAMINGVFVNSGTSREANVAGTMVNL